MSNLTKKSMQHAGSFSNVQTSADKCVEGGSVAVGYAVAHPDETP